MEARVARPARRRPTGSAPRRTRPPARRASDMTAEKPRVELTRGDVLGAFWRWTFFSHSNYNYERLQGTAFAHMMTPIIKRLYTDPEEIRAALKRHLVFFNTEPNVGSVIPGAVIAMEEQRA